MFYRSEHQSVSSFFGGEGENLYQYLLYYMRRGELKKYSIFYFMEWRGGIIFHTGGKFLLDYLLGGLV